MSAGYATSLMKALRESYTNSPAALREVSASLSPSPHRHILQTGSWGGRQPLPSPAVTLQEPNFTLFSFHRQVQWFSCIYLF